MAGTSKDSSGSDPVRPAPNTVTWAGSSERFTAMRLVIASSVVALGTMPPVVSSTGSDQET
jgi:hypothetical protein